LTLAAGPIPRQKTSKQTTAMSPTATIVSSAFLIALLIILEFHHLIFR
jgi:hypothetical protein